MSQQLETLADYIKARQIGGNHYKTQIQPWWSNSGKTSRRNSLANYQTLVRINCLR